MKQIFKVIKINNLCIENHESKKNWILQNKNIYCKIRTSCLKAQNLNLRLLEETWKKERKML
jgi:hypothetical protein